MGDQIPFTGDQFPFKIPFTGGKQTKGPDKLTFKDKELISCLCLYLPG